MVERLYSSDRFELRRVAAGDGRRIVVTFDSYHVPTGLDRPGFGEAFFEQQGVTALHLLSCDNGWFQSVEMAEIMGEIARSCVGADRIMTYGSSMGGYGAIRFARAIGAHAALALSPQYSLDPRLVPFETRWAQEQRQLRFRRDIDGPIARGPDYIVAYDPRLPADRRHAELIAAATPTTLLPLPHAGHPVGAFLADTHLLRPLALAALAGTLDRPRLLRAAYARRGTSPHWLAVLAERQPAHRLSTAVALAKRAEALAPQHQSILDFTACTLARAGRFDEAVAMHRRAIAIEPDPAYRLTLSKTLQTMGDLAGALAIARDLQAEVPGIAGHHAWAAKLRELQGDTAGQLADLRAARRGDPANRAYRYAIGRLRWRLALARLRGLLRRR